MGAPRLYWDTSNTLDIGDGLTGYRYERVRDVAVARADSGQAETSVRDIFDRVLIELDPFDDQDLYDGLVAWWSWAQQGKSYGFAYDSDDTVDTTLSADASAGATSVTVSDATGITADTRYRIRSADGLTEEIVEVDSVSGTTVTLSDGLTYGYGSGAIFRSVDYFPALEAEDKQLPVRENPGLTWTFRHQAREYRS